MNIQRRAFLQLTSCAAVVLALALPFALQAQQRASSSNGPRYVNGTSLARPTDYREWIFLSSGIDMTYPSGDKPAPAQQLPPRHSFTNVFVNPSAYRAFLATGKWPNGTVLVLESRRADAVSKYFPANQTGQYQSAFNGLEANVKDSRFPDGWKSNLDWSAWFALAQQPGAFVYVARRLVHRTMHLNAETTRALADRAREDALMFRMLWPAPIAAALNLLYSPSRHLYATMRQER